MIFGYVAGHQKLLRVIGAGDGGLAQLQSNLDDSQPMFAFLQLEERAFAFIQWCPEGASSISRARAAVHRSFVTSFLGSIAVDVQAQNGNDIATAKIVEALEYFHSTSGRQLDGTEAAKKLMEQEHRKNDNIKRQALTGNTHEAQKKLASLLPASSSSEAKILKVSGTNVSKKAPPKLLSSTLFEQVPFPPSIPISSPFALCYRCPRSVHTAAKPGWDRPKFLLSWKTRRT